MEVLQRSAALLASLVLLGATNGSVALAVRVDRTSLDLLDVLSIRVAADNRRAATVSVKFPTPREYVIDVLRGDSVIYSSLPPSPAPMLGVPPHVRAFLSGPTPLGTFEWNELATDGSSPLPGRYTVRVRLLNDRNSSIATTAITFAAPTPISALAKLRDGAAITVAGRLDPTLQTLTDSTGSIKLSHRLLGAMDAPVAVRGYIAVQHEGSRTLAVSRWAPLGEPKEHSTP